MRNRIVVADDHGLMLDGLRRILGDDFDIVGAAKDGRALLAEIETSNPDVAVVDVAMPLLNGIDVLRQARSAGFRTRFVFVTAIPDVDLATQAFRLGASGYVLKHAAAEELVTAIREALEGHTYITPRIAQEVLTNLLDHRDEKEERNILTGREREVLQLLAEGKVVKEVASIIGISPRTVEFHKNNIVSKTGLKTTAELARYAARVGLVSRLG